MKEQSDELNHLIAKAKAIVAAMSPEERAAMFKAQIESWVRGELDMGLDADEAKVRAQYALGVQE